MSKTPKSDAAIDYWPIFTERIRKRMETAKPEYGDRSFERSPAELADEIQQELLDQCAWSYINWRRIEELKPKIERLFAGCGK